MEHRKQAVEQYQPTGREQPANYELRFFEVETRASSSSEEMKVGGYAAMFGKYTNMGWYAEVLEPGFFDGCDMEQCACLFNHDVNMVLGRKRSSTLILKTDYSGLDYESKLPKTRADVYEVIERGDVYQSSFGFSVKEAKWEEMTREQLQGKMSEADIDMLLSAGTVSVRRLVKCRTLYDVSPVTFPAYADTTVAKRSLEAYRENQGPTAEEIEAENRATEMEIEIALLERKLEQIKH